MTPREVEELRKTALSFLQSAFLESGEIKVSGDKPEDWETPIGSRIDIPDILDDLELKANVALRHAEGGWRVRRMIIDDATRVPNELAQLQPFHIRSRRRGLEVFWLVNEGLRRVK